MSTHQAAAAKSTDTREGHRRHESAILAVGHMYYLMGLGLLLAAGAGLVMGQRGGGLSWPDTVWVASVFAVTAAGYGVVGYGFRSLATWARYGAGGLALLVLASLVVNPEVGHPVVVSVALLRFFAMPVGAILTLYAAYLALCKEGGAILSAEYRRMVAAGPVVSYVYSKVFLAIGLVLAVVQSLRVVTVFTGK